MNKYARYANWLAQSVSSLAAEQLDCKERVDNLVKTLNGDEQ